MPLNASRRVFRSPDWVAVGILLGAFLLGVSRLRSVYTWDEAVYLATAETLGSDEPYYTEVEFRPPLLPMLLRLGSFLLRVELFGQLVAAALFASGALVLYRLGRQLWGFAEGLVAAALWLASPFLERWAGAILTDIPAAALVGWSLYFLFEDARVEGGRPSAAALSGALLAAAFLARWPAGLAGVAAAGLLAAGAIRLRSALTLAAAFLLCVAPYALWAALSFGSPLAPLRRAMVAIEGSEVVNDPTYYFKAIFMIGGPAVFLGLLFYIFRWLETRDAAVWRRDLALLLVSGALLAYLTSLPHKEERYIVPGMPSVFLLAAAGYAHIMRLFPARGLTAAGIVAALLLPLARLDYYQGNEVWVRQMLALSADTRAAAGYLRAKLGPDEVVYSNHIWPIVAFYTKRKTVRIWPSDERFYEYFPHNMPHNGLLVFYRGVEKQPTEDWLARRPEFQRLPEFGSAVVYAYRARPGVAPLQTAMQAVQAAREAYAAGEWAQVLRRIDGIENSYPGVACLRGWSLYKLGRIAEAEAAFEAGVAATPTDTCVLNGAGYTRLRSGDLPSARRRFAAVLGLEPNSVDALIGLGLAELYSGRRDDAARRFRRVLEIEPGHSEAAEYLERATGR